ncbi:hypothetical protein H4R34_006399, partial [Dimargaris verticillata]
APLMVWSASDQQQSSRLMSVFKSNALIVLPPKNAGQSVLESGDMVSVILIDTLLAV